MCIAEFYVSVGIVYQRIIESLAELVQALQSYLDGEFKDHPILTTGVPAAVVSSLLTWWLSSRGRKQTYYMAWIRQCSEHNWLSLRENAPSGLAISNSDNKIQTVCYQHLNMFLLAWLHRDIVSRDGSAKGWRNWARAIIKGAEVASNHQFRATYYEILRHGDMYPEGFLKWLAKLGMNADAFAPKPGAAETVAMPIPVFEDVNSTLPAEVLNPQVSDSALASE